MATLTFIKPTVLSGGLGTEIERRGVHIEDDPLWSAKAIVTNPELICEIYKSFLLNGADIITTASYQASVDGYQKHLGVSANEALNLIGRSVTIAKEAKEWFKRQPQSKGRSDPLIGGSVGPYGACLHDRSEYTGSYMDTVSEELIKNWHKPRIKKLLESGVDFLAVETIPSMKEAQCILEIVAGFVDAKAWISFCCKNDTHTCYGDDFADTVDLMSRSDQVLAVGINCTPPQFVLPLLNSCKTRIKPFVVYPNSVMQDIDMKCRQTLYVSLVKNWYENGAKIIGGCCGIRPEDISIIRSVLINN